MKITQKIFYISFIVILFLDIGFYLSVPAFSIKTFEILEESRALSEANNMRYYFAKEIKVLDSLNKEWSRDKNVYEIFDSNDRDREYLISTEFDYEYVKDLKIDYLSFVTPKGKLLYGVEVGDKPPMSDEFAVGLTSSLIVEKKAGLVRSWYSDDVMAVSVRTVTDKANTIVGYVIMTKKIDSNIIAYSGQSFVVNVIDGSVSNKLKNAENDNYIDKKSGDNIYIYSFFDDILGEKAFYSKTLMTRDVYNAGISTINAISYSAFVLQLLMIIAFLFIFQRMVIERLKMLIESIKMIGRNKQAEISITGEDEISILSQEINVAFRRANTEKNLSIERQKELDLILKSMHDVIIIMDESNKVISSYSQDDSQKYFVSDKFLKDMSQYIEEVKRSGDIKSIDYCVSVRGKKIWYNINILPKKDAKSFKGVIVVIRNIADNRRMQERMEEKIKELERLNKLMTDRELRMIELKKQITEFKNGGTKK